jgi:hypothetical protein
MYLAADTKYLTLPTGAENADIFRFSSYEADFAEYH